MTLVYLNGGTLREYGEQFIVETPMLGAKNLLYPDEGRIMRIMV